MNRRPTSVRERKMTEQDEHEGRYERVLEATIQNHHEESGTIYYEIDLRQLETISGETGETKWRNWTVDRRYSEFVIMREHIEKTQNCEIDNFPGKALINTEGVLNDRKIELTAFMNEVVLPVWSTDKAVTRFIELCWCGRAQGDDTAGDSPVAAAEKQQAVEKQLLADLAQALNELEHSKARCAEADRSKDELQRLSDQQRRQLEAEAENRTRAAAEQQHVLGMAPGEEEELQRRIAELSKLVDRAWEGRKAAEDALCTERIEAQRKTDQGQEALRWAHQQADSGDAELLRRVEELSQQLLVEQNARASTEDALSTARTAGAARLKESQALMGKEQQGRRDAEEALSRVEHMAGSLAYQLQDERVASVATAQMRAVSGQIPRHRSPNRNMQQLQFAQELQMACHSVPAVPRCSLALKGLSSPSDLRDARAEESATQAISSRLTEEQKKRTAAESTLGEYKGWISQAEDKIKELVAGWGGERTGHAQTQAKYERACHKLDDMQTQLDALKLAGEAQRERSMYMAEAQPPDSRSYAAPVEGAGAYAAPVEGAGASWVRHNPAGEGDVSAYADRATAEEAIAARTNTQWQAPAQATNTQWQAPAPARQERFAQNGLAYHCY